MELVTDQENLQLQEKSQSQENLQLLARELQAHLLSLSNEIPFQVQCVLKHGNLLVLSQHPPGSFPDSDQVFDVLQRTIQTRLPDVVESFFDSTSVPSGSQAKLYLRILGQKQPYTFRSFRLLAIDQAGLGGLKPDTTETLSDFPKSVAETFDRDDASSALSVTESGLVLRTVEPDLEITLEQPVSVVEEPPPVKEDWRRSPWLIWIAAGVGVSIISFAGGMFLMTRPCMIRACEPLEKAQLLNRQAIDTIQKARSEQDIRQAQQQLNEASQLLKNIPAWTQRSGDADALLQADQSQVNLLEQVLAAESKADAAEQKRRQCPKPLRTGKGSVPSGRRRSLNLNGFRRERPLSLCSATVNGL